MSVLSCTHRYVSWPPSTHTCWCYWHNTALCWKGTRNIAMWAWLDKTPTNGVFWSVVFFNPDDGCGRHRNIWEFSMTIRKCTVLDQLVDNNLIDMHGTNNTVKFTVPAVPVLLLDCSSCQSQNLKALNQNEMLGRKQYGVSHILCNITHKTS